MERPFDLEAARAGEPFYYENPEVRTKFIGEIENAIVFAEYREDDAVMDLVVSHPERLSMPAPPEVFVNLYLKPGTVDEIMVGPCTFDDEEDALECGPDVTWGKYLRTVAVELPT